MQETLNSDWIIIAHAQYMMSVQDALILPFLILHETPFDSAWNSL